jgi:hypothetical protein
MDYTSNLDHEIRISTKSNIVNTVSRVWEKFETLNYITLSGINRGIANLLLIGEICKVKFGPLHQANLLETLEVCSVEDSANDKKLLTRLRIWLYKKKPERLPNGAIYQSPYSQDDIDKLYYVNKDISDDEDNAHSCTVSMLNSTIVPYDHDYHSSDFDIHSEEDNKKKTVELTQKIQRKSFKNVKKKEDKKIPGLKKKNTK